MDSNAVHRTGGAPVQAGVSPEASLEYLQGDLFTRRKLHRAFLASGVSTEALLTWTTYCNEWGLPSHLRGALTDEGYVRVWPKQEKARRYRRCSESKLRRHLAELEEFGLLVRLPYREGHAPVLLKPAAEILAGLLKRPEVEEALREMYPDSYDRKVLSLEDYLPVKIDRPVKSDRLSITEDSVVHSVEEVLLPAREPTEAEILEEVEADMKRTFANMFDHAAARTEAAREKQQSKPSSQKMGAVRKKAASTPKNDRPLEMLEFLRSRVKDGLSSVYQPPLNGENLAKMKRLIDAHGAETLRQVIEWVTVPGNWQTFARRCNVTSNVPTPGLLEGFGASLFPMALEGAKVKRSGGAEHLDVDPRSVDSNDFV